MSNNLEELNLKKSLDLLIGFYDDVKKKKANSSQLESISQAILDAAENALKDQAKFSSRMEYRYKEVNDSLIRNERRETFINYLDSLNELILFYNKVVETNAFTADQLNPIYRTLNHRSDLTERIRQIGMEIREESRCGKRPRLPREPISPHQE